MCVCEREREGVSACVRVVKKQKKGRGISLHPSSQNPPGRANGIRPFKDLEINSVFFKNLNFMEEILQRLLDK